MRSYWFGDVSDEKCTRAEGDADALAARLVTIRTGPGEIIPADWGMAVDCGAARDRADYISRLREVCMRVARDRVAAGLGGRDAELVRMVLALEGIDESMNQLTERLADWYRVRHPEAGWKYRPRDSRRVLAAIAGDAEGPVKDLLDGILTLRGIRSRLAAEIGDRAAVLIPNCSALVGGLVAARLMTLAGGVSGLARLPASSIQVLGARGALFSHLTRGTPPPKHGIIFQHMRVHNAPRDVRGKVARVLAGRLAIAARIDENRGTIDPGFIEEADRLVGAAGGRG